MVTLSIRSLVIIFKCLLLRNSYKTMFLFIAIVKYDMTAFFPDIAVELNL